jgi:hypothetical protein
MSQFSSNSFEKSVEGSVLSFDELKLNLTYPSIMIPFVHLNKVEKVKPLIEGLRIGKVARVDRVLREDARGKHYQVYIHFEFWDIDNPDSCRLRAKISHGGTAKLEYESPWFWTLVLNSKVRPPHEDPYNYFPSVSFTGPTQPPIPPQSRLPPQFPVAPAFHQLPVAPAFNPFPVAPAFQQLPVAPAFQQLPVAPAFNQFPVAPAFQELPVAPAFNPFPCSQSFQGAHAPLRAASQAYLYEPEYQEFLQETRNEKVMIPRVLRMAAIGHFEKRRPRTREIPPAQLVAFKNPPQPVQEDPIEELIEKVSQVNLDEEEEEEEEEENNDDQMSDVSDDTSSTQEKRKTRSKGYYNDADAPKADIVVPDYGTAEEIQMAVKRIRGRKTNKATR